MKLGLVISIFIVKIAMLSSILVETGKKDKYCFYKDVYTPDKIHLSYVISGENEEKVNTVLFGPEPQNKVLFENFNSENGQTIIEAKESGFYKLCFLPLNSNSYYISIDLFTENEKGHVLNLAKDQNLHDMKNDVSEISLLFEQLEQSVKFEMDRRSKHSGIINEIGNSIVHISYLKIFVILLVTFLQVLLIRKFFGENKKTSNSNFYSSSQGGILEMGTSNL